MLQAELQAFPPKRRPVISIYRELVTRHGANDVSYQMVRTYVGRRRATIRRQSLSPAHQAVSDHDLNRLRDLLNGGHDIEDDSGDGWSLLRRAIRAEADRHTRTGEPLHADMTALLLARGAEPREDSAGTAAEAELLGHWLAAEIISAARKRHKAAGNSRRPDQQPCRPTESATDHTELPQRFCQTDT
jgi:hypothetical protein